MRRAAGQTAQPNAVEGPGGTDNGTARGKAAQQAGKEGRNSAAATHMEAVRPRTDKPLNRPAVSCRSTGRPRAPSKLGTHTQRHVDKIRSHRFQGAWTLRCKTSCLACSMISKGVLTAKLQDTRSRDVKATRRHGFETSPFWNTLKYCALGRRLAVPVSRHWP